MSRWFRVITTMSTLLWLCSVFYLVQTEKRRSHQKQFSSCYSLLQVNNHHTGRLLIAVFSKRVWAVFSVVVFNGQKCQGSMCVCLTLKQKPEKFFLKLCMTTTAQELMSKQHWLTMLLLLRGTTHAHTLTACHMHRSMISAGYISLPFFLSFRFGLICGIISDRTHSHLVCQTM